MKLLIKEQHELFEKAKVFAKKYLKINIWKIKKVQK